MEKEKFLESLLRTDSVSGCEEKIGKIFKEHLLEEGIWDEDKFGNIYFEKGKGRRKIMISAHMDEIGFLVSGITKNGFVRLAKVGGIDLKVLPGSLIQCGDLKGIIGKKPIHVEDPKEREKVIPLEDLVGDFGFSGKEEAEKYIKIGDPVSFSKDNVNLHFGPSGNLVMGPALDDKVGIYIISEVFKRVNLSEDFTLYCVGMTQEEPGLRGAAVAARCINPEISIDIDVCPATEKEYDIKVEKYGEVKMGGGIVIPFGVDKSRRIAERMIKICDKEKIPYQRHVAVAGGTNTSRIQMEAFDCETMLLSLPNHNMHTPVEKCSWTDINACIELMIKYIENYV